VRGWLVSASSCASSPPERGAGRGVTPACHRRNERERTLWRRRKKRHANVANAVKSTRKIFGVNGVSLPYRDRTAAEPVAYSMYHVACVFAALVIHPLFF